MDQRSLTPRETDIQLNTQRERVIVINENGEIENPIAQRQPSKPVTMLIDEQGEYVHGGR